jgi:hypothetical protein
LTHGEGITQNKPLLKETLQQLAGELVILDLGSAHSRGLLARFPELAAAAVLVEVDAQGTTTETAHEFHRRVVLRQAVAGQAGRRLFKRRAFPEASSFLDPDPDLVRAYGLGDYFELVGTEDFECVPVAHLLAAQAIERVDLLKTDLEGLDFEVLQSAPELVRQALCVQCELRFQPFFQGEPPFHVVVAYLDGLGLDLVWLRPQVWKYATSHRSQQRRGRLVWADAVFLLRPDLVRAQAGVPVWKALAKQVILARLLGLENQAEYLYAAARSELPEVVRAELSHWLAPRFDPIALAATGVRALPGGWMLLEAARRACRAGYRWAGLYKDRVVGMLDG